MKFNVGDRIICVKYTGETGCGHINIKPGDTGTIKEINNDAEYPYTVSFDDFVINRQIDSRKEHAMRWGMAYREIQLIESDTEFEFDESMFNALLQ